MQWCSEQNNTEWVDEMTGLVQRSMDGRQTRCFIMSGEIHQCSLRLRDCFSNMRTFWETLRNKLAVKYKLILVRSCRGLYDTSEMEIGLAIKVNLQICWISSQQLHGHYKYGQQPLSQYKYPEMMQLPTTAQAVHRIFLNGNLVVRHAGGSHNAIATDMLLEHAKEVIGLDAISFPYQTAI